MRQIGHLPDERQAQVFLDYLLIQGISAQTDSDESGWAVWVRNENDVQEARTRLAEFEENPADSRYQTVSKEAQRIRDAERDRRRVAAKQTIDMRGQWSKPMSRRAPLVMTLIGLSIALSLFSNFGQLRTGTIMRTLGFTDAVSYQKSEDGLEQVSHGQVWRTVTPILLHGSILHLLFNMYWLYVLGTQVEARKGSVIFGAIVLAIAVISNLAQFFIGGSPNFLGMSGVVYGILGYIWIKQQFEPGVGFQLNPMTFGFLMFWLVLCFTGAMGPVANWAHLGGLLVGMAIAYFPVLFPRSKARA
ncbi:MAG: rhomboid family intramembrane serine protease [Planctomycetaceae bacterium]|nr:rhomboid family intramembrane serine protease [Planctomycetaceae bacterium]